MAKHLSLDQGSVEWLQARLGIPTASEIHKIITSTGMPSKQSKAYAYRLVAERLLGRTLVNLSYIDAIASGKQLEPEAISLYEFDRGVDTIKAGFVTTDDGQVGCSPDRLVGQRGLLECKSPLPQTHISYLLDGFGGAYHCQRQCQLFVTEREYLDMMSYCRELPPVIVRYRRDEVFIAMLSLALEKFCSMLHEMTFRAVALGAVVKPKRAPIEFMGPSLDELEPLNETAMRMYAP